MRLLWAVTAALGAAALSPAADLRYPSDVLPQHHDELVVLRRKTDLGKLAAMLEQKRAERPKVLDGEARLAVSQIILRAQAAQNAPAGAARDEIVNQVLELAAVYSVYMPVALGELAWVHPFFSETELFDDLKSIDIPVLVMHGEDDQICPFSTTGARSVKLLKHGTLKSYPGLPHGMPTTHAAQINADLLAFFKA